MVMTVLARIRIVLAAALLLSVGLRGSVPRLLADWRAFASPNRRDFATDIVTREAAPYEALVSSLPARGTIGYLQPDDWPGADAQRRYYLAMYTLTPRVIAMGTDADFVIVSPEASVEGGETPGTPSSDPRLGGFVLVNRFENGLRIFRRLK